MNENVITIEVPKVGDLITKRPEGMDFKEYKRKQREQDLYLHGYSETFIDADGHLGSRHIMGRLDGILIPSHQYKNGRNPQILIR